MKDLGNFSQHPYSGVFFTCAPCDVSWTGCAAAADCPRCGRGYDWNDPSAPPTVPAGIEECENNDCTGCAFCDAMGYTREPPPGWTEALETWLRIWHRTCRELERKPHCCRAILVERTSYRRLRELMAQRP